jgi:hypothetical protein
MRISEHALTRPCVAEKSIDSGADPSRVLMGRTREIAKFRQLTQGASGTAGRIAAARESMSWEDLPARRRCRTS